MLQKKHNSVADLVDHGVLTEDEAARLFKFACVRNPFDSLVSFYLKKRSKYQPLLDDPDAWIHRVPGYVEDMKFCRDHSFEDWIVNKYGGGRLRSRLWPRRRNMSKKYTEGVDFVMRYERLQEDFDEALRRAGVKKRLTIPQVNKTTEKTEHYRDCYTPRARRIVERVFSAELQQYGYRF